MSMTGPTTNHVEIHAWAESRSIVPVEMLPHQVDHEPSVLRLMFAVHATERRDLRLITWEEFFVRFDLLGLTFVYDTDTSGYNALLQIDDKSPYRNPLYRTPGAMN